jgi:pyrroloquinoline quinone biosynthesis protein D
MTPLRDRISIGAASIPRLPRGVKFRRDEARGRWVLLAPERLFEPDEIAVEILALIDGQTSVDAIVDMLATRFAAPRGEVAQDVIAMLQDLADKGCIEA